MSVGYFQLVNSGSWAASYSRLFVLLNTVLGFSNTEKDV